MEPFIGNGAMASYTGKLPAHADRRRRAEDRKRPMEKTENRKRAAGGGGGGELKTENKKRLVEPLRRLDSAFSGWWDYYD